MELDSLNEFIQSRWSHKPVLKSYRLIGKMLEVKFEDGFGEVIEVGKYYDCISDKRGGKLEQILK
jgi:hypothetical protein